jgi:hypothetical protein
LVRAFFVVVLLVGGRHLAHLAQIARAEPVQALFAKRAMKPFNDPILIGPPGRTNIYLNP